MGALKHNIIKIYLYSIFRSFILAYVVERLFWASRGMSITDTVYTEFVYAIAIIVMEIPSGLWADRYGRKIVMVVGSLFNVIASAMMLFIYGLPMFSLAIGFSAINGALTSGSVNALLYESLEAIGEKHRFERVLATVKMLRYGSGFIAAFVGAYTAANFTLLINYEISLVSTLIALVIVLTLKESPQVKAIDDEKSFKVSLSLRDLVGLTIKTLKKDGSLRRMMCMAGAIGGVIIYIEEFWQNFFEQLHVDVLYFGLFSGVMSLSVMVASHYSPKVNRFLRQQPVIKEHRYSLLLVLMICLHLIIGLFPSLGSLVFMGVAVGLAAINENMIFSDLHHRIDASNRATMESVYSMVERSLVIFLGLIFGWTSDRLDVFSGFVAIGVALLFILVLLTIFQSRGTQKSY